jgi:energy-converting hydrogenase Eha subunit A
MAEVRKDRPTGAWWATAPSSRRPWIIAAGLVVIALAVVGYFAYRALRGALLG